VEVLFLPGARKVAFVAFGPTGPSFLRIRVHDLETRAETARIDTPRPVGRAFWYFDPALETLRFSRRVDTDSVEQPVRAALEQRDRYRHDPGKGEEWSRRPGRDGLRVYQGERLRHQLTQNDVKAGNDRERDYGGDGVGGDGRQHAGECAEPAIEKARQNRLADPAEPEGGEGDPELSR